ncbi:MAG: SET domain-containing protein [Gammaproteobacteria bacterium]|nr:SET domain-containing protein [Gammaproteobacteria bacterium]
MKKTNKIYVDNSPIHGKGLFAKSTIAKDELIGTIEGKPAKRNGAYVLWIDDETKIRVQCDLKYINHSDSPNACYYDSLEVIALRRIRAGEEITHDYDSPEF